jgi:hypothetical protein
VAIKPKIPTNAPTRVLSSKTTLRWPHQRGKPPTRALQKPPTEPTPTQLAEQEKHAQAQCALQAKKATTTSKNAAAASQAEKEAAAVEAETQNNLSQHEDNQSEQILHGELNLEL